ncbi:uncharacterized protein C2orf81 homolog, partial [Pristis pectinata]|uniref:uncharacterized protein C2orf81 homolog n=1 Tax=Pristis pectinata TaxID=685728 RepID=UPI00223E5EA8
MSRSAVPKSRSEKSRAMAVPATTPQVALVEIIPGRFTETDWQTMVAAEDGENNVMDIIEDIVSQALDQCYSIYIENQLLPFTIAQAKDAILQIIEWQFLTHDPGESNVSLDHSWQEDREPKANVTDSWAQGSVPVLWPPHTPALQEQEPRGLGLCPETEDCYSAPAGHGSTCGDQQPGLQGPRDTSPLCSQLMGISQDLEQVETEPEKTSTVNVLRGLVHLHRVSTQPSLLEGKKPQLLLKVAAQEPEQAPEAITVRKKSHSLKARRCL